MSLSAGTRLGPYEIVAPIGAGAMGEVYKARDTRLDRTVAVKILMNVDPARRANGDREARAIAALQHPNICTLYDVGHENGIDYLVLEYLQGETLAARLARGPLKLEAAVTIAIDIADALEKAHRAGIVHGDLKPANLMLLRDGGSGAGAVKLLDFGVARLQASASLNVVSATTTSIAAGAPVTGIAGTLQYMSPEQLEGGDADRRADIWALGCVIFEMIAGRPLFAGASSSTVIASIVAGQPDRLSTADPLIPPMIDHIVGKCVARAPDDRWQSARDIATELKWALAVPAPSAIGAATRGSRLRRAAMVVLAVALVAALAAFALRPSARVEPEVRFTLAPPERTTFVAENMSVNGSADVAVSPDGSQAVFVAAAERTDPQLWVRPLDALDAHPLRGTDGGASPFWAPDGRAVGFFAHNKLRTIDLASESVRAIADAPAARGGTWNARGTIVFAPSVGDALFRVQAAGGNVTRVTMLDQSREENSHRWPQFLPGGRRILYFARSAKPEHTGAWVASLDGGPPTKVMTTSIVARYSPPGLLLFVRDAALMAQRFDADTLQLGGDPVTMASAIAVNTGNSTAGFTASERTLAYTVQQVGRPTVLRWIDRSGRPVGEVPAESAATASFANPALSADGRRLAIERVDPPATTQDIWLLDIARGTRVRFTFDPGADNGAIWSPDDRRLVYASRRAPMPTAFYERDASASGAERLVAQFPITGTLPTSWSSDGRQIVYQVAGKTGWDIYGLPLDSNRRPVLLVQTAGNDVHGELSPDGRWLAFASDESGRMEVFVQPMPPTGGKWQVSVAGGAEPRWRRDQRELFYAAADGRITAVPVTTDEGFAASAPTPLFATRIPPPRIPFYRNYAVTPDGQRFLVNSLVGDAPAAPITIVLNWTHTLQPSR
jgi:Tol biopolymer transport system component